MAEPFKLLINLPQVRLLAESIQSVSANFLAQEFVEHCMRPLDELELKDRVRHVAKTLDQYLPPDFSDACALLTPILAPPEHDSDKLVASKQGALAGWIIWPITEWVVLRNPPLPLALNFLMELTQRFSSEFAVRPFIQADPRASLSQLQQWVRHPSVHVRRWVSEGTRPRLPWGIRLDTLIQQPQLSLELIAPLFADPSEYVRRSVANHLNDVSKDHPDLAIAYSRTWLARTPGAQSEKLVRHALRSLIKAGHPDAIELLGFQAADEITVSQFRLNQTVILEGEYLDFSITVHNPTSESRKLSLDYAVHFLKANGKRQAKVFKWKTLNLPAHSIAELKNRHHFKPVTIRKHYGGDHALDIRLNGVPQSVLSFELKMPNDS